MIIMRGSAIISMIKNSIPNLPSPQISNKEIIWKLTGREMIPQKENKGGSNQKRMKINI